MQSKPMSRKCLMEALNIKKTTITNSLKFLKEDKLIYIHHYEIDEHRKTPFYMAGNKPDAVYQPMQRKAPVKRYKQKFEEFVVPKEIKHHPLLEWVFKR
jgi:predicted transcriptional regulator